MKKGSKYKEIFLSFKMKEGSKYKENFLGGTKNLFWGDGFINLHILNRISKLLGGHSSPHPCTWFRPCLKLQCSLKITRVSHGPYSSAFVVLVFGCVLGHNGTYECHSKD